MKKMIMMMIRIRIPIITSPARIMRGMAQIGMASGAAVGIIGQAGGGKMVCEPFPQN